MNERRLSTALTIFAVSIFASAVVLESGSTQTFTDKIDVEVPVAFQTDAAKLPATDVGIRRADDGDDSR